MVVLRVPSTESLTLCFPGYIITTVYVESYIMYNFSHQLSKFKGSREKKIIERVHNVRSASAKKRPPSDEGESKPVKKGRPKGSSLLNRYPPISEGKHDAASTERNMIALQREMQKERPRKDVILSLLSQTFETRRDEILSDGSNVTVTSIISTHKALTFPYAVCAECNFRWLIIICDSYPYDG